MAWLRRLAAAVGGLSPPPASAPSLFEQAAITDGIDHRVGEIRDVALVARTC